MRNGTPEDKISAYLEDRHGTEALDLNVRLQKNEGNLMDARHPYIAKYTTADLSYRKASIYYFNEKILDVKYDTYSQELACLSADQEIEKEAGDIPFVIYTRIMSSRSEKLDWILKNYSTEGLKKKIFADAEFQILVLVTAPDILDNKRKYEEFHIEIMRRLKEQHIENGTLEFRFLADGIELEASRTSPEFLIMRDNPIQQHTIQRWASIHRIEWYDMVKERPDKVLKYGKVFDE